LEMLLAFSWLHFQPTFKTLRRTGELKYIIS
jgi:hypothetical protein